jgi:hypothetical protein
MDDKVEIYGTKGVIKADLTHSSSIDLYSPGGVAYTIEKAGVRKLIYQSPWFKTSNKIQWGVY